MSNSIDLHQITYNISFINLDILFRVNSRPLPRLHRARQWLRGISCIRGPIWWLILHIFNLLQEFGSWGRSDANRILNSVFENFLFDINFELHRRCFLALFEEIIGSVHDAVCFDRCVESKLGFMQRCFPSNYWLKLGVQWSIDLWRLDIGKNLPTDVDLSNGQGLGVFELTEDDLGVTSSDGAVFLSAIDLFTDAMDSWDIVYMKRVFRS